MRKSTYYIIGTIFIVVSGLIYTFERFFAYYSMIGQRMSISQVGSGVLELNLPTITTNMFVTIFLVLGIVFYICGYQTKLYSKEIN